MSKTGNISFFLYKQLSKPDKYCVIYTRPSKTINICHIISLLSHKSYICIVIYKIVKQRATALLCVHQNDMRYVSVICTSVVLQR